MTKGEPATAVGAEPRDTGVGSVFVSNYPPYSFWRRDRVREAHLALDGAASDEGRLGLYVHIPFCRKRCKFCYFRVFTDKNATDVRAYGDAVLREAASYAERKLIAGRPLRFVYFGGGTPSYISAKHLRALVAGLRSVFPWDDVEEVTFECEPGTLTRPKLEAIREVGVTRLSLGVENFDDRILAENGRAHLSAEIERALPWIREIGFDHVNVDLIAGMIGETEETWKDTVEKTVAIDADSVTVYQLELPFNTVYSKSILDGRSVTVADWETKRRWHDEAFRRLEGAGYEISSAYTMVKRGSTRPFVYRDSLWHGADLLGLGVSSFSHLAGVHFQNVSQWQSYLGRVAAGELAIERAYTTTEHERLTRELILQLKLGRLDAQAFRRKFDVDILVAFREAFERLFERGMVEFDAAGVRLTRAGLLRVDSLLPEFYAPQHQNARYT